jgi:hypothetical protein
MVCNGYGIVGADARPNWKEAPLRETLTGCQPTIRAYSDFTTAPEPI